MAYISVWLKLVVKKYCIIIIIIITFPCTKDEEFTGFELDEEAI